MVIDCQDSERQIRRKIRPLISQARLQHREVSEANLWLEARPCMDLALDRDMSWLLRQVTTVKPDVVMIGPLCNLAPRALNSDDDAAPVIAAMNMIRARGACLILEAHAGHALGPGGRRDMRPRGSSAFLGWPEFGYGLRWTEDPQGAVKRTVDMVSWRGDRDERPWPEMLTAGGVWPWKIYDPVSAGWEDGS
jgi:replicative DNA helicase